MPGPCIKRHILHNFPGPADQAMCGNPQCLYFRKKDAHPGPACPEKAGQYTGHRTVPRQTDIVDHQ